MVVGAPDAVDGRLMRKEKPLLKSRGREIQMMRRLGRVSELFSDSDGALVAAHLRRANFVRACSAENLDRFHVLGYHLALSRSRVKVGLRGRYQMRRVIVRAVAAGRIGVSIAALPRSIVAFSFPPFVPCPFQRYVHSSLLYRGRMRPRLACHYHTRAARGCLGISWRAGCDAPKERSSSRPAHADGDVVEVMKKASGR